MGALAVEVPQIQFFDDQVVEQFQFFDNFFFGPGVVPMFDVVQYIDKLLMCPWSCRGRFRCNGTLLVQCLARQSGRMFLSILGALDGLPIFST